MNQHHTRLTFLTATLGVFALAIAGASGGGSLQGQLDVGFLCGIFPWAPACNHSSQPAPTPTPAAQSATQATTPAPVTTSQPASSGACPAQSTCGDGVCDPNEVAAEPVSEGQTLCAKDCAVHNDAQNKTGDQNANDGSLGQSDNGAELCSVDQCSPPLDVLGLSNTRCTGGTVTMAGPTGFCIKNDAGGCQWEVLKCNTNKPQSPAKTGGLEPNQIYIGTHIYTVGIAAGDKVVSTVNMVGNTDGSTVAALITTNSLSNPTRLYRCTAADRSCIPFFNYPYVQLIGVTDDGHIEFTSAGSFLDNTTVIIGIGISSVECPGCSLQPKFRAPQTVTRATSMTPDGKVTIIGDDSATYIYDIHAGTLTKQ